MINKKDCSTCTHINKYASEYPCIKCLKTKRLKIGKGLTHYKERIL